MHGDHERRKRQLFCIYSNNLKLWRPELAGQYMCPLCLKAGFSEDSVRGPEGQLTLEHSIQKGLGRPFYTLTCIECNPRAGASIDADLHKRLEWEGFLRGGHTKPLNIRMDIAGENLGVDVTSADRSPPHIDITIVKKQSNQEAVLNVENVLHKRMPLDPIKFRFPARTLPVPKNAKLAMLKSAYLIAFRQFGYGYILAPVLDPIRRSIQTLDDSLVPLDAIILNLSVESLPESIIFVTSPEELECFAIPLAYRKHGRGFIVAMPNNGTTYGRWKRWRQANTDCASIDFKYNAIPYDQSFLAERIIEWFSSHTSESS